MKEVIDSWDSLERGLILLIRTSEGVYALYREKRFMYVLVKNGKRREIFASNPESLGKKVEELLKGENAIVKEVKIV